MGGRHVDGTREALQEVRHEGRRSPRLADELGGQLAVVCISASWRKKVNASWCTAPVTSDRRRTTECPLAIYFLAAFLPE
jgi:hypothetical protein